MHVLFLFSKKHNYMALLLSTRFIIIEAVNMFSPIRKRTPWTVDHNASLISPKDNFLYPNTRLNFQSEKEEKSWRQKTKQLQQLRQLQLQQLLKL